jgi:hypothetical protein
VQTHILTTLLPIELELARARVRCWNNDPMEYVDALVEVLRSCRRKALKYVEKLGMSTDVEEMGRLRVGVDEWKGNLARVGLVLASQLVEMKVSPVEYDHMGLERLFSANGSTSSNLQRPPVYLNRCATQNRVLTPSCTVQLRMFTCSLGMWTPRRRI